MGRTVAKELEWKFEEEGEEIPMQSRVLLTNTEEYKCSSPEESFNYILECTKCFILN